MQADLFGKPSALGKSGVEYVQAGSVLTRATGFMGEYDYTLNPYSGCTFGCNYCYAAFFARTPEKQASWGQWVSVKENALSLLRRAKPGALDGKTIYMSSVTDPYQPIERRLELTRGLLKELAARHRPCLVIQTRSPLVVRDLDVLSRLRAPRVNMTVTTDSEEVRRAFEPTCPENKVRLRAIAAVQAAGLDAGITLTPLLPVEDPDRLADDLLKTGVERFVVQPFHPRRGRFVAGTRPQAMEAIRRFRWDERRYAEVLAVLRRRLPNLEEGRDGFAPPS